MSVDADDRRPLKPDPCDTQWSLQRDDTHTTTCSCTPPPPPQRTVTPLTDPTHREDEGEGPDEEFSVTVPYAALMIDRAAGTVRFSIFRQVRVLIPPSV